MHHVLGYSLDEWVAILTIVSIVGGILIWLLNVAIKNGTEKLSDSVKELINQIHNLGHTINLIQNTSSITVERIDKLEDRFEEHIGEAKVRNQKIRALEHEVFDDKKGNGQ